ncbi:PREDICTED: odorant receptor 43a-like, partial [Vollenhovia emeryi]|uniref:odorant receptor 43a-like n=1 Tax=Vollenhovia emeryi TaxID=411798 RepID=UPI0005F525A0
NARFKLINAVTSLEKVEIIIFGSILCVHIYVLFVANYFGQDIIDSSSGMCQATYNAQWYAAPLGIQKLILLIIQRSNRRCTVLIGGLFDASLEGFNSLVSMSLSYVMVLQSVGTHKESEKK